MNRSFLRMLAILGVSIGAGIGYARFKGLELIPSRAVVDADQRVRTWIKANALVELERFQELVSEGAVVIDAREKAQYEAGRLDLGPQAFVPVLHVTKETLLENLARLYPLQGYTFALYCNSRTCDLAEDLFVELVANGFPREMMFIYPDGWEGIQAAGLPTTSGPDLWQGDDLALSEDADEGFAEEP